MAEKNVARTKVCGKCGEAKPATPEFFNRKLTGLQPLCRPCSSFVKRAIHADLSSEERDAIAAVKRAKRAANLDEYREKDRQKYAANPEIKKTARKKHRERHLDACKARDRAYYEKNRQKLIAGAVAYAKADPERTRRHNKKATDKIRTTPRGKLRSAVSAHIYFCLRKEKHGHRWESLVGYTLADLMRHLERQFTKGMSWDNYGRNGWHIDHILPVSGFSFASPSDSDFRACWSLTNLRPLWEPNNISKGAKRLLLI